MSDIDDRIKRILVEHLGVEPEKVVPSASFIDDLGTDSLDQVELCITFEEEFGVEITDDAAELCPTVGDVQALIAKLLAGRASTLAPAR